MPESLQDLEKRVLSCRECSDLERINPVMGSGDLKPDVMFVGIAPSAIGSDKTGVPFTSPRSGSYLRGFTDSAGLRCYYTNVIKCLSAYNKDRGVPKRCAEFIEEEIVLLNPLVVVTLGAIPAKAILKGQLIKHMMDVAGRPTLTHIGDKEICVYPMYHPNWVLREDTPEQIEIRNTVFKQMFLDLVSLVEKRRRANAVV